jgi:hypothetical protein
MARTLAMARAHDGDPVRAAPADNVRPTAQPVPTLA